MVDEINHLIQESYKDKLLLKETQLKALQAQINPHFYIIRWIPLSGLQRQGRKRKWS